MAIISQFDTDPLLMTIKGRHHAWHEFPDGAHGFPSRQHEQGTPGSGLEFLQFHRDLMQQFFAWNNIHHAATPADIAAWTAIPIELKLPETGWPNPGFGANLADAEARINSNMPAFADDDAFGIFLETTIHNWIHGAVAASSIFALSTDERNIISSLHSVQSTYFYKIHGLVQFWWDRHDHPKSHIKEIVDQPVHKIAVLETKHLKDVVEVKPAVKEVAEIPKHIKEKDKDLVENKNFSEVQNPLQQQFDPVNFHRVVQQMAQLQEQAGVKQSPFIKPLMRPPVGQGITRRDVTRE